VAPRQSSAARWREVPPAGGDRAVHRGLLSHDAKLVVELDGETHADPQQVARDARKTRVVEEKGYRVIRFFNSEVREDIDDVVRRIRLACGLSEYPEG
jgi:very-short-patch-repair endonuclease